MTTYYRKTPATVRRDMLHNALSVVLFGALVFGMMRLFASCRVEEAAELAGGLITVERPPTRSLVSDADAIRSVQVAAYRLEDGLFYKSASTVSYSAAGLKLDLLKGYDYRILSLINCGDSAVDWPARLSDAEKISLSADDVSMPGGVPMAGDATIHVSGDFSLVLKPERMVSRWRVEFVDRDALGYAVKFARMRQSARDFTPWASSKATSVFDIGDRASVAGTELYVLENMRGTLRSLSGNESAGEEELMAADPADYGKYTYLELGLDFPEGAKYKRDPSKPAAEADVIYRVYLRGSAMNDFDIRRNTACTLTITGTQDGLDNGTVDWKIEDNSVPAGNEISGTLRPAAWNAVCPSSALTADHFTPTFINRVCRAAGYEGWRTTGDISALTGDEAAMTAVCGSADALHLLLKEGDPEGELAPFERAAISFGLGSSIGAVLRSAPAGLFSITEYGPDAVLTGYPSGVDHNFSPGGVFVCESLYYSAYGGRQITIISLLTGDTCFTGKSTVVGTPSPLTPAMALFGGVRVVCTVRNIGVCGFFCEPL